MDKTKRTMTSRSLLSRPDKTTFLRISSLFLIAICCTISIFIFHQTEKHMEFTADALQLVCHLKENTELKSSCYKHVITALHVTVSDIMRKEDYEEETVAEDKCASPEIEMTKGLICVSNSCPGEAEAFQSFRPWSWFTSVADDLIEECQLDTTKCLALLQPPPGYIYGNDYATVIGVSAASMVATTLFTLTACLCYRRHRRNAVIKDGYQRLLNDGDQS